MASKISKSSIAITNCGANLFSLSFFKLSLDVLPDGTPEGGIGGGIVEVVVADRTLFSSGSYVVSVVVVVVVWVVVVVVGVSFLFLEAPAPMIVYLRLEVMEFGIVELLNCVVGLN